jgi:two-component system, response regulator PdtaR
MSKMNPPLSELTQVETAKTTMTAKTQRPPNALRVLIVEDEAMIAMLLAEVLTGLGHEVCATEATEAGAVAAAARHQPELMIVDDELRRGNGIAAVEQITRSGFIPPVFVTGKSLRACLTRSTSHTVVSRSIIPSKIFVRVLDPICRAGSHTRLKIM